MPETRRTPYPEAALHWMIGNAGQRVLELGSGRGRFSRMLAASGHQVFGLDRSTTRVGELAGRLPSGLHVVAQAESLPYADQRFDVVCSAETLHRFAPGLVGSEIARVLRPGGVVAVLYYTRDDTVPWVRKLARILQYVDPDAMRGAYGQESVTALADSNYFVDFEQKNFRDWVPITRPGLLEMVRRRPVTQQLEETDRQRLLDEVGALYDSYARSPEPLMLPFQASCWRAVVDHQDLAPAPADDDGLEIPLGF